MKRFLVLAVTLIVALTLGVGMALANPMDGYGTDPTDDWGSDEHLLCRPADCSGEISVGNVVGVWQIILHVEGYLGACGTSGVDGVFGTTTYNATRSFQSYLGITSDGKVGSDSWGRADDRLEYTDFDGGKELIYDARRNSNEIDFYRPYPTYHINWQPPPYVWYNTDHYDTSIDQC